MSEIMIHIASTCSLACPTCAYQFLSKDKLKEYAATRLPFDEFTELVDKAVAFGIDSINLTSIIGEPLQIPDFEKYARYLQDHDGINSFTFFTSLTTRSDTLIPNLLFMDKLKLVISVSGTTEGLFIHNTGTDKSTFERFSKHLNFVLDNIGRIDAKVDFFIRYKSFFNKVLATSTESRIGLTDSLDHVNVIPFHKNGNWGGLVPDEITQKEKGWVKRKKKLGICGYTLNENTVLPNGDVLLCGAIDVEHKTKLGNINEIGFKGIYEEGGEYHRILKDQQQGIYCGSCEGCSEHHPIDEDIFTDVKTLIPWMNDL